MPFLVTAVSIFYKFHSQGLSLNKMTPNALNVVLALNAVLCLIRVEALLKTTTAKNDIV